MHDLIDLQGYLEDYFRQEGFYDAIAPHRRTKLFNLTKQGIFFWIIWLWASEIFAVVVSKDQSAILYAVFTPFLLFFLVFASLGIYTIRARRRHGQPHKNETNKIGNLFVFGLPIVIAFSVGVYVGSLGAIVLYLALSVVGVCIYFLLITRSFRIHLLFELFISIFKVSIRSLSLLVALVPLLLVVILLSVFSHDLWQVLSSLSAAKILAVSILLLLPVAALIVLALRTECERLASGFPDSGTIVNIANNIPYFRSKLQSGHVSHEEWVKTAADLSWRDIGRLSRDYLLFVRRRVKRWFVLLFTLTSLFLFVVFFIYFFVLVNVLLDPSLIVSWTGTSSTTTSIATTSIFLSVFAVVSANVYGLTDEKLKERYTAWLKLKADSWLAAGCLYECVISPRYQVWEYLKSNKKEGIVNVSIVVPTGLSDRAVEEACDQFAIRLQDFRFLVTITAYEQREEPVYRRDMPGKQWELFCNRRKNIREFKSITLDLDDLRYQDELGLDSLKSSEPISDGWFGNKPLSIDIGREIWTADIDHKLIMHPYILTIGQGFVAEIHLIKRLAKSQEYRQYINDLLVSMRKYISGAMSITIVLQFRDTTDTIAELFWNRRLPYVQYKDVLTDKSQLERPESWNLLSQAESINPSFTDKLIPD